jgi:hypothetical protein
MCELNNCPMLYSELAVLLNFQFIIVSWFKFICWQISVLPVPKSSESTTQGFCIIHYVAFCVLQVVLITYCANNGDVYRILNGYDTCGNVCGRYNAPVEGYDKRGLCVGEDKSKNRCVKNQ